MLTKYTLTIGTTTYDIPDECLKNWDDISFELKRTDYSGVMRSYSTEFEFVGDIADMLWELYLDEGFKAEASVAVYTITDTHTWDKQFEEALDFSTIEMEQGVLTINALDNTLASLLKSKKSQKYEWAMDDLDTEQVTVNRVTMSNQAVWNFPGPLVNGNVTLSGQYVNARIVEGATIVISKTHYEPRDESSGYDGTPVNRHIIMVNGIGVPCGFIFKGRVRHPFYPGDFGLAWNADVPIAKLNLGYYDSDDSHWQIQSTIITDDISKITRHGMSFNSIVGGDRTHVYASLNALIAAASSETVFDYKFGVVGSRPFTDQRYWEENTVYEYYNGSWRNKGFAKDYCQWRELQGYGALNPQAISSQSAIGLQCENTMTISQGATLTATWADQSRQPLICRGITPETLATKIVQSIAPGTQVSIAADTAGALASTLLVPAEELRHIEGAKCYCTFDNFCSWIQAVFGYTYRINGNSLEFVHRSEVFVDDVVKTIDSFNEFSYSVADSLIYATVEAGYAKKDYGEISGRLEKNFTNYYSTEYNLTDKKLSLISKFRADIYGIEYTAQKASSDTKDDKSDEDIFVLHYTIVNNVYTYAYDNTCYAPAVCVENNKGFIAPMGNGAAVVLTMTSSDGDNTLTDITIPAGSNLFTCGEIEFETDDMVMPGNLNALVQLDWQGYRYKGFIQEAECRYGKRNGVKYTLIVKEITEI